MTDLGDRIRLARRAAGLKQHELAKHFDVARVSVTQWEAGKTRPDPDKLPALAVVLKVSLPWLMEGVGDPPKARAQEPDTFTPQIIPGAELVGDRDFPIYAATAGGDGHMIVTTDVIERVRRPANLEGVTGAYGILITGNSMAPAYRHGDMALIHPGLQPLNDEVHVFYDHDPKTGEGESMIKNLLSYTADKWRLEQFNPERKFSVDRVDWPICHRVVGKYNRR
jgi:phage repressor protein C with HTH and peptisase S24 domain